MAYKTAAHCVGHRYNQAFERVFEWTHDKRTTEEMAFQEAQHTANLLYPVDVCAMGDDDDKIITYRFTDGSVATLKHTGVSVIREA